MNKPANPDAELDIIKPMIEYYAREMGELAGRLMAALSLLVDLEDSYGWDNASAQARETVHYSRLLVASVLRIVATAQREQDDETGIAKAIDEMLERYADGKNGGQAE